MGRKYTIRDQRKLYFVTFTVVYWIVVFIRDDYREIFLDSVKYCQENKGSEVYACCIMPSHVHLILGTGGDKKLEDILRDLKSFTARHIRKAIESHSAESRKEWMLWMMKRVGSKNSNNKGFQFWQQHNHPIELNTNALMEQCLNYIHNNPVEAAYVQQAEAWTYSRAGDYAGNKGLLELNFIA